MTLFLMIISNIKYIGKNHISTFTHNVGDDKSPKIQFFLSS